MGNPLSPFICNLYINSLKEMLSKHQAFPKFWNRYVDDIVAIINFDKLNSTLELINSACPNIKFTYKMESDHCLPFLDLLLRNNNGIIEFDIYQKPI